MGGVPKHCDAMGQEVWRRKLPHLYWRWRRHWIFRRTRIGGRYWGWLCRQESMDSEFVIDEVDFWEDGAQVEVDVRRTLIVGRNGRQYEMLRMLLLLLRLLLALQHLRVAAVAALRRAAHVALMNIVMFALRLLLLLLLLLLWVDGHGWLQKVGVWSGRVWSTARHRILRASRQQEHTVVK